MLDLFTIATARMKQLYKQLSTALPGYADLASKDHLIDLCTRLKAALEYQKHTFPGVTPTPSRGNGLGFKDSLQQVFINPVIRGTEHIGCWD